MGIHKIYFYKKCKKEKKKNSDATYAIIYVNRIWWRPAPDQKCQTIRASSNITG